MIKRPYRTAVVAIDRQDGEQYAADHLIEGRIYYVTVRSPHAARGCIVDAVVATPAVTTHPLYAQLLAATIPCLYH